MRTVNADNKESDIPVIHRTFHDSVFMKMDDDIANLPYQLGDNSDFWYPQFQEILDNVDWNSDEGIRFLLWCTHPREELIKQMTPEQKEAMGKIKKMLYTINLVPDEE